MTFPSQLLDAMASITPLNRVFVSPDYDQALVLLGQFLDFRILEFEPRDRVNLWTIPPRWELEQASIKKDGRVLYDGTDHALKIIAMSTPFEGVVSLDQLRGHLHFDHRDPDWIPFHFRQLYRPWDRTWGFCVTRRFYDSLSPGDYEVVIRTRESEAPMKVADFTLPGQRPETVALVAHLDHPGMANDDLAGVIVGVRVMQLLATRPRHYSYRLVLVQEKIGSEYYLSRLEKLGEKRQLVYGLFLEMLGTDTPHALQLSCAGQTAIDLALQAQLRASAAEHRIGPFCEVIGNDEAIWETHGVPMPSLSRFPYKQYHSHRDDMSIIRPERLEESARLVADALAALDSDRRLQAKVPGAVCLSHPDVNLYVDAGQPAFADTAPEEIQKLRKLMDLIPIALREARTEAELAAMVDLPVAAVRDYLDQWVDKDLIREV